MHGLVAWHADVSTTREVVYTYEFKDPPQALLEAMAYSMNVHIPFPFPQGNFIIFAYDVRHEDNRDAVWTFGSTKPAIGPARNTLVTIRAR